MGALVVIGGASEGGGASAVGKMARSELERVASASVVVETAVEELELVENVGGGESSMPESEMLDIESSDEYFVCSAGVPTGGFTEFSSPDIHSRNEKTQKANYVIMPY